uniref:CAP-Gly domain-containing linker protein 2 n=1 Tax=Schistocephalus solidus TaxID=70667 RepID=A0A183SGB7_SCHSO
LCQLLACSISEVLYSVYCLVAGVALRTLPVNFVRAPSTQGLPRLVFAAPLLFSFQCLSGNLTIPHLGGEARELYLPNVQWYRCLSAFFFLVCIAVGDEEVGVDAVDNAADDDEGWGNDSVQQEDDEKTVADHNCLHRIATQMCEELQQEYAASEARFATLSAQRSELESEVKALRSSSGSLGVVSCGALCLPTFGIWDEHDLYCYSYFPSCSIEAAEHSSSDALQQLELKSLELQSLQERLLRVSKEHEAFQDKQEHLVTSLETEKRICMERLRRAEKRVESLEKELQSRPASTLELGIAHALARPAVWEGKLHKYARNPLADLYLCSGSPANGKPRSPNGQDAYDGQVNFLNSIIVDLHAKNAKLEEQLRDGRCPLCYQGFSVAPSSTAFDMWYINYSLNVVSRLLKGHRLADIHPITQLAPKQMSGCFQVRSRSMEAPKLTAKLRFWCDYCEVFDLHDTDSCPSVSAGPRYSNQPPRLAKTVGPSVNRAYCDHCEVFDKHNTEDCPEVKSY